MKRCAWPATRLFSGAPALRRFEFSRTSFGGSPLSENTLLLGSSVNRGSRLLPLCRRESSLELTMSSAGKKQERKEDRYYSCSTIWEKRCERFRRAVE